MAFAESKLLAVLLVAGLAVASLASGATAAEAPAPSPTSATASLSSPLVAALICSVVALLAASLRH